MLTNFSVLKGRDLLFFLRYPFHLPSHVFDRCPSIWNMSSDLYPTSWIMSSDLFSRHLLGFLHPGYPFEMIRFNYPKGQYFLLDQYQASGRGGEGYSGHRAVVVLLSSGPKLLKVFQK